MASGSQPGMQSLATIIKRLEAVTSRLEDVATTGPASASSIRSPTSTTHDAVAGHLNAPAAPPAPPTPSAASAASDNVPFIKAYQTDVIDGPLDTFLSKSKEVGGLVDQVATLFPTLCNAQLNFLRVASSHAKPSAKDLGSVLQPQAEAIQAVIETKDKLSRTKDGRDWGTCLNVMGEGAGAWGWEPTPVPFIGDMKSSAQFWADRVTKQFKDDKPALIEWHKSFIAVIDALQAYAKQWHTRGVAWSAKGSPATASDVTSGSSSAPTGGAGAPPPPPPPPPAGNDDASSAPAASSGGGHAALLASLNRGGSVTSGLKKVDASQMTHKNPELRTSSVVPDKKEAPAVKAKPGALTQQAKKPPKMELEDGNKWLVEYQDGNKNISIEETELHQTVHLYGCTNSVVRVSGKINAVTMVNCKKTALVIHSAVSSLSVTSSPSFEIQITGTLPTIQIDNTDSGNIYLSKDCMENVEIITSKTSALNISVPTGADGDFEERPVPEQMRSKVIKGKLVTEIVEHAG